jgi:steroid delta-isomerase-like uncharacterized protein
MSGEEYKALFRESLEEIWNRGNLSAIEKFYTADYVSHDPSSPEPIKGYEGIRQFVTMYRGAFPDLRITIEDQVCEGDKVVTRWTARGTHMGELMGIAPTGKFMTVTGMDIGRIGKGRITEEWSNYDALGMLQQIGAIPAPSEGAR